MTTPAAPTPAAPTPAAPTPAVGQHWRIHAVLGLYDGRILKMDSTGIWIDSVCHVTSLNSAREPLTQAKWKDAKALFIPVSQILALEAI